MDEKEQQDILNEIRKSKEKEVPQKIIINIITYDVTEDETKEKNEE